MILNNSPDSETRGTLCCCCGGTLMARRSATNGLLYEMVLVLVASFTTAAVTRTASPPPPPAAANARIEVEDIHELDGLAVLWRRAEVVASKGPRLAPAAVRVWLPKGWRFGAVIAERPKPSYEKAWLDEQDRLPPRVTTVLCVRGSALLSPLVARLVTAESDAHAVVSQPEPPCRLRNDNADPPSPTPPTTTREVACAHACRFRACPRPPPPPELRAGSFEFVGTSYEHASLRVPRESMPAVMRMEREFPEAALARRAVSEVSDAHTLADASVPATLARDDKSHAPSCAAASTIRPDAKIPRHELPGTRFEEEEEIAAMSADIASVVLPRLPPAVTTRANERARLPGAAMDVTEESESQSEHARADAPTRRRGDAIPTKAANATSACAWLLRSRATRGVRASKENTRETDPCATAEVTITPREAPKPLDAIHTTPVSDIHAVEAQALCPTRALNDPATIPS